MFTSILALFFFSEIVLKSPNFMLASSTL